MQVIGGGTKIIPPEGDSHELGVHPVGGDIHYLIYVVSAGYVHHVLQCIGEVSPGGGIVVGLQQTIIIFRPRGRRVVAGVLIMCIYDSIGHLSSVSVVSIEDSGLGCQDPAVRGWSRDPLPLGADIGGAVTARRTGRSRYKYETNGQCRGDEQIHRLHWPSS